MYHVIIIYIVYFSFILKAEIYEEPFCEGLISCMSKNSWCWPFLRVLGCLSFPEDWWKNPPELKEKSEEQALRDCCWCFQDETSSLVFSFLRCFIKNSFTLEGFFSFFWASLSFWLINKQSLSAKFSLYYWRNG